jgi:signal transduction histidine kinase
VRRRLVLLSLATTVLVVMSFLIPLGLLVRRQAVDGARVRAETSAQSVAALVALALAVNEEPAAVAASVGSLPSGTIVVMDGLGVLGEARPGQGSLATPAAESRSTVATDVPGGWEIALPVVGAERVAVVDSFVTNAEMTRGVGVAWLLLATLALLLIGVAVWVADRMGRGLTRPVEELARSAHRLAEGDLETRVEPEDPEELREMGEAFNYLAGRLDLLLAEERESAADLSHRLRTPLTSLRLQAEALADSSERAVMVSQVDRLEHAVDQVIEMARSSGARTRGSCDVAAVVAERARFWEVLAEEQGRDLIVASEETGKVDLSPDALQVIVDTLVGNVFAHTPPGTAFEIRTGSGAAAPWVQVADRGPGFGDHKPVRGESGAGSTGLGLDIVRKTAASVGGVVDVSDRPGGGAVVTVRFG